MQIISLAQSENEITANILKNTDLENISPPAMEGLDEMISTGRRSPIKKEADSNGTSTRAQMESAQWYNISTMTLLQ